MYRIAQESIEGKSDTSKEVLESCRAIWTFSSSSYLISTYTIRILGSGERNLLQAFEWIEIDKQVDKHITEYLEVVNQNKPHT